MVTYKFVSKADRGNSVVLRITSNRKSSELSVGTNLTDDELQMVLRGVAPKSLIESRHIIMYYTNIIEYLMADYASRGIKDISAADFKKAIQKEVKSRSGLNASADQGDFIKFYRKRLAAAANAGYKASINYTLNKIIAFCNDPDNDLCIGPDLLRFEDITLKWLNAFDEWLVRQGAAKNSRNIHFKNIRTVINRAIDEELTEKYPFRRFRIRPEETPKRSMSVESVRKLFDYDVEPYQEFYRDIFKLIFLLIGINATDLYRLKHISDGRINFRRAKTHRLYSIKVEPEAMEIIEKYRGEKNLLCIADRWSEPKEFVKNINIALKKIGHVRIVGRGGKKEITPEWPNLSTYVARHSWATIASSIDIPKDVIAHALGHGKKTVTDVYIDYDMQKVDEANRKVIDHVLYGK